MKTEEISFSSCVNKTKEWCINEIRIRLDSAFADGGADVIIGIYKELKPYIEILEHLDKIDDILRNTEEVL